MMDMLFTLIAMMVSEMYAYVQTHQIVCIILNMEFYINYTSVKLLKHIFRKSSIKNYKNRNLLLFYIKEVPR